MVPVARMEPIQSAPTAAADGGLISATGTPRRVTSTDVPVRRTRSSTARQVALNSEIAMDSTGFVDMSELTMVNDHGQLAMVVGDDVIGGAQMPMNEWNGFEISLSLSGLWYKSF